MVSHGTTNCGHFGKITFHCGVIQTFSWKVEKAGRIKLVREAVDERIYVWAPYNTGNVTCLYETTSSNKNLQEGGHLYRDA